MPLGYAALPPAGFVDFCKRRPSSCGDDAEQILREARRAERQRADLSSPSKPASLAGPRPPGGWARRPLPIGTGFVPAQGPVAADASARLPDLTPELWAALKHTNAKLNRKILEQDDLRTYGREDYWNTPLEQHLKVGDCEDIVLEKQRALLALGLPRSALNIAIATTSSGESHALLLVSTRAGEFVLDSRNDRIEPWRQARYDWQKRELHGDPFDWVMIRRPTVAGVAGGFTVSERPASWAGRARGRSSRP